MPRLIYKPPAYKRHKASGQAYVLYEGSHRYLGPFHSPESLLAYKEFLANWSTDTPVTFKELEPPALTLGELAAKYTAHARSYYRKDGEVTREADMIAEVLDLAAKLFGNTRADEFGPKRFERCRLAMISKDWCRQHINKQAGRLRRAFRWAVSAELMTPTAKFQALKEVPDLAKGRTKAKESKPVESVPDAVVDDTVPHMPDVIADMVRLQRLTGTRPGEVCALRPCDVDRSGEVWIYEPERHKNEHHDKQRTIPIGPKAQDVLRPYLLRSAESYCFSPQDSEKRRRERQHDARTTPLSCGNRPGTNRTKKRKRPPRDKYETGSYRRAIHRACDRAEQTRWSPNRLRHTALSDIRSKYGLEAAQVVAGHSNANVTQVYAERDLAKAIEVARQVG